MPDKNIIRKILPAVIKDAGQDRVLEFTISTESPDRDGEVIKAEGWQLDNYRKNPVVLWAHRYDEPPVGKALEIGIKNGKLVSRVEFADKETYPFADTIYRLCKGGFLNAVSVGFIPLKSDQGAGDIKRIYVSQEMLEHSIVPVPSNPEALAIARNAGLITMKEFETVSKGNRLHEQHPISQAEIKDELDYLAEMVKESGLSEENKTLLLDVTKRFTGSDMPVDIKTAPIRAMLAPVLKMMDEHHNAHEKWYAGCHKAMQDMCDMPEEEDNKAFIEFLTSEIKNKINGG